jgi:predicted phosphoribosyltransferase
MDERQNTENIVENGRLRNKAFVFEDRFDAGDKLADLLESTLGSDAVVLAVPSGGVPVAQRVADNLALERDLIIVRKLQIPWNPEAGFGSLNLDGDIILNDEIVRSLGLSQEAIDAQVEKTKEVLEKRDVLFRQERDFPALEKRTAILIDDGLASGYTMIAAVEFVRRRNPSGLVIAVPTGSYGSVRRLALKVDLLFCLNVKEGVIFAVADAYKNWHDLSDDEVMRLIKQGYYNMGERS